MKLEVVAFVEVCLCGLACPPRRICTVLYDPSAVYNVQLRHAGGGGGVTDEVTPLIG